ALESGFVVLARAQTLPVRRIDLAVGVVVDAVAAGVHLAGARGHDAVLAAPLGGVTGLTAGALRVVRLFDAAVQRVAADLRRARDAVARTRDGLPGDAPGRRVRAGGGRRAPLLPVAHLAVVALAVLSEDLATDARHARLVRAGFAVVRAGERRAELAPE